MQKEELEGLFMPTINKKSSIIAKSKCRNRFVAPDALEASIGAYSRCKTPTKINTKLN
jgi:hypothetical protein